VRSRVVFFFFLTKIWSQQVFVSSAASGLNQVAPGSLTRIIWSSQADTGTFPPSTSVALQLGDHSFSAEVVSNSLYGEILAVIPDNIPAGVATLTLTLNTTIFPPATVTIAPAAIGIFTPSGQSIGPATAQNISGDGTPSRNALTTPALPGQYVTLWGTGLGAFRNSDVTVSVAGKAVSPTFAGRAPGAWCRSNKFPSA
jgi:uncharacterized protein (TIGR03437 family)